MTEPLLPYLPEPNDAGQKENSPDKNKGGRPKGGRQYANCRLNIYLSAEEFKFFREFVGEGWYDKNASVAGRYLLLRALHEWDRKGRKRL
jgi:hypothetical protein